MLVNVISCTNMMRMAAVCTDDTCEVWVCERPRGESVFMSCERSFSVWEIVVYELCVCLLDVRTQEKSWDVSLIPIVRPSAFRNKEEATDNISGGFVSLTPSRKRHNVRPGQLVARASFIGTVASHYGLLTCDSREWGRGSSG